MANTPGPDNHGEAADPGCIRTVLAELVLTFLFVFIGVGSTMSAGRMAGGAGSIAGLTAAAVAHSLAAAVLVTAGFHLSGGHLNPAVTVSLAVSGRMTVVRSVLYVAAQVLGSSLACLLLRGLTGGLATPVHALGTGMGPMQGVLMEIIFTFTMLFLVYATILDPRTSVPGLGPLLTGLLVGANTLSGGAFSGASMNPARSFGPALATGVWTHHWVYWVGPLTGGPLAVLVYEFVFMEKRRHGRMHEPLLGE